MQKRFIRQMERHIQADENDKALALVLKLAPKDPLDDDLHHFLDQLVEDHPFRHEPLDLSPWSGYRAIKPHTDGKPRDQWWPFLYALPETNATLPLPRFQPRNRAYRSTHDWSGFTTPHRLSGFIPLHPPSMGFYTWYDPRVAMDDDVLTLEQFSVFNGGRKGQGNEDIRLRIYRVRGDLFHARYVRFYLWS